MYGTYYVPLYRLIKFREKIICICILYNLFIKSSNKYPLILLKIFLSTYSFLNFRQNILYKRNQSFSDVIFLNNNIIKL